MIDLRETAVGIEFGSTRIKAVLTGRDFRVLASGTAEWENRRENGIWTYGEDDVLGGLRACYASLKADFRARYGQTLTETGCIGISGMMHGYMPFDAGGRLLTPFRTWRNNNAAKAAEKLTRLFSFNIPARWTIAHLYEAVLDGEPHVWDIASVNTLAGHVHELLTGRRVVGVGEASGILPVDPATGTYDASMREAFDSLPEIERLPWTLCGILPEVLPAGAEAGRLTEEGARLLDPEGDLAAGIPFCPPEGDAGTGMVSTDCVEPGCGNVSAGTSVFGMVVLERGLSGVYPEIDVVSTPDGAPVAMVHCNNCSSEINAWAGMFSSFASLMGFEAPRDELYSRLFGCTLDGAADCGGIVTYNYLSGENITGIEKGRPMVVRSADSDFTLPNFFRSQLYSSFVTLKIGFDMLSGREGIRCGRMYAQGGLFKTEGVCQGYLAAALDTPVTVTETAGEGGAWGMSVLAMYALDGAPEPLGGYLRGRVFAGCPENTVAPDSATREGFDRYTERFMRALPAEKAAGDCLEEG